jgi:UDP-N-acetylmuramoyl-tripeptide--D-alanyl-D-alanine ligase
MLELGASASSLHRESGRSLADRVDAVVGVGALARDFLEGAREAGMKATSLHAFAYAQSAAAAVATLVEPGDAVLVKGSRGVHLERVVDALLGRFEAAGKA